MTVGAPRRVCGACVSFQDHVLLVKQRESQKWGLPKGTREGSESVSDCVARELQEETGLCLAQVQHKMTGYHTFRHHTIYFYELVSSAGPPPLGPPPLCPQDQHEIEKAQWLSWTEAETLPCNWITNHLLRWRKLQRGTWRKVEATPHLPALSRPILPVFPPRRSALHLHLAVLELLKPSARCNPTHPAVIPPTPVVTPPTLP